MTSLKENFSLLMEKFWLIFTPSILVIFKNWFSVAFVFYFSFTLILWVVSSSRSILALDPSVLHVSHFSPLGWNSKNLFWVNRFIQTFQHCYMENFSIPEEAHLCVGSVHTWKVDQETGANRAAVKWKQNKTKNCTDEVHICCLRSG